MVSSSSIIDFFGDVRKGRIISTTDDQHMQAKRDVCDLSLSQLCSWKCESSGMWCSVIRFVGLDISRTLQTFSSSGIIHFVSWCHIPQELLLQTLLGPMPHVMIMWYKVLSDFIFPWQTQCSLVGRYWWFRAACCPHPLRQTPRL